MSLATSNCDLARVWHKDSQDGKPEILEKGFGMKNFFVIAAGIAMFSTVATATPELVPSPVDKVFTPLGFDDNDDVEIILHGDFPSDCYKVGPAHATVDEENRKITVEATAWYYAEGDCVPMTVPFIQPVRMGMISQGDYEITVIDRPNTDVTPLFVAQATSRSPDDFTYAPVAQVDLKKQTNGAFELAVEGEYPYMFVGCMRIVDLRAHVTPGRVLVVQPISEIFLNESDCADQVRSKKFRVTKSVSDMTDSGEYLAHVRALSGQSVNRLFNVTQ